MVETNTQRHLDIRTRFRVINNIRRTLRFDERRAVVDKLPENSPVRFLAEIALHGLADPKGKMSADELAVQTRLSIGGVRTDIFDANLHLSGKA
jgi:predicted oxidoreductase